MSDSPTFWFRGNRWPARGVLAVKQVSEKAVEVRWARSKVVFENTTTSEVLRLIDEAAAGDTDSA